MKKIGFIVILLFFVSQALTAQEEAATAERNMDLDFNFGYLRYMSGDAGYNGFNAGVGFYYAVLNNGDSGFLKSLSIGAVLDVYSAKLGVDNTSFNVTGVNIMSVGVAFRPTVRVDMPYSFIKFGFGYLYRYLLATKSGYDSLDLNYSDNHADIRIDAGGRFFTTEKWEFGLVASFGITPGTSSFKTFTVGPYFRRYL